MTPPLVAFVDQVPSIVIAIFTLVGVIAAAKIGQRGKLSEVAQDAAASALTTPFEQLQAVADRHETAAQKADERAQRAEERADRADARTERVRTEWEQRWSRQMDRCRMITDVATNVITDMMAGRCTDETAGDVLDVLEHHRAEHPEIEAGPTTLPETTQGS